MFHCELTLQTSFSDVCQIALTTVQLASIQKEVESSLTNFKGYLFGIKNYHYVIWKLMRDLHTEYRD